MTYEQFSLEATKFGVESTYKRSYQSFTAIFGSVNDVILVEILYRPNLKKTNEQVLVKILQGKIDCDDAHLALFTELLVKALEFRDYLRTHL